MPGCSDDVNVSGKQELDHAFEGVSGTVQLTRAADGTLSGVATDLLLEGRRGEDPIALPELVLMEDEAWDGGIY